MIPFRTFVYRSANLIPPLKGGRRDVKQPLRIKSSYSSAICSRINPHPNKSANPIPLGEEATHPIPPWRRGPGGLIPFRTFVYRSANLIPPLKGGRGDVKQPLRIKSSYSGAICSRISPRPNKSANPIPPWRGLGGLMKACASMINPESSPRGIDQVHLSATTNPPPCHRMRFLFPPDWLWLRIHRGAYLCYVRNG